MKLPGFPVPVLGETFSSVVARHLARSASPKTRSLGFLGLRLAAASSLVPRELQTFANVMPPGHPWAESPKRIVLSHTMVPLFLSFAHPQRAEASITDICAGLTRNPAASLGLTVTMLKQQAQVTKFCPDCAAQDIAIRGFPVLYRQHQPAFVRVCAVHARPLLRNCIKCQTSRRAACMWQMAGHCSCDTPLTPPALEVDVHTKTEEAWLWLSRQVSIVLSETNPIPSHPVAASLFAALIEGGFAAPRGGLNSIAITSALIERFGVTFIKEVGADAWCNPSPGGSRPSRVLTRSAIEGERIPNVLHALLLSRLVVDDISTLFDRIPPSQSLEEPLPRGYGQRRNNEREAIDIRSVTSAIKDANGKITVAARMLGINSYTLAADMQHLGLRFPLPAHTAKRLGAKTIGAVRKALRNGIPKNEIQSSLGVSEWSIQLIQLDTLNLCAAHRNATVARQRDAHRNALLAFRRQYPSGSRSQFQKSNAGSFDWFCKFDYEWYNANLPSRVAAAGNSKRKCRNNWQNLDQAAVLTVQDTAQSELAKTGRPKQLTRCRLLSAAGALAALGKRAKEKYPKAYSEAQRLSESKDEFRQRVLSWALQEYAKLHLPISANKLRRVAHLPPTLLLEYRDYVIEVAEKLQLTFDARCSLSPWHLPIKKDIQSTPHRRDR